MFKAYSKNEKKFTQHTLNEQHIFKVNICGKIFERFNKSFNSGSVNQKKGKFVIEIIIFRGYLEQESVFINNKCVLKYWQDSKQRLF